MKKLKKFIAAAAGASLMFGILPMAAAADVPLDWTFVATFGEDYDEYGEIHPRSATYEEIENGFRLIPGESSGVRGGGQLDIAFNYIQLPADADFRIYGTMQVTQTTGASTTEQFAGFMVTDTLVSAEFGGINPADGSNIWLPVTGGGPPFVFAGIAMHGPGTAEFVPTPGFSNPYIFVHRTHEGTSPARPWGDAAIQARTRLNNNAAVTQELHVELLRHGNTFVSIVNGIAFEYDGPDIIQWYGDYLYVGMMASRGLVTDFTNVNVVLLPEGIRTLDPAAYTLDASGISDQHTQTGLPILIDHPDEAPDLTNVTLVVDGVEIPRERFGVVAQQQITGHMPFTGIVFFDGARLQFQYEVHPFQAPGAAPPAAPTPPPPAPTPEPADNDVTTNGNGNGNENGEENGFPTAIVVVVVIAAVVVICVVAVVVKSKKK